MRPVGHRMRPHGPRMRSTRAALLRWGGGCGLTPDLGRSGYNLALDAPGRARSSAGRPSRFPRRPSPEPPSAPLSKKEPSRGTASDPPAGGYQGTPGRRRHRLRRSGRGASNSTPFVGPARSPPLRGGPPSRRPRAYRPPVAAPPDRRGAPPYAPRGRWPHLGRPPVGNRPLRTTPPAPGGRISFAPRWWLHEENAPRDLPSHVARPPLWASPTLPATCGRILLCPL